MTYLNPLRIVLQSLDSQRSTNFGHDDLRHWPEGVLPILLEAGVLRQSDYARSVICRECPDACSVEVHFIQGEQGEEPRAFFDCPERDDIPRVWVPLDELRTYSLSAYGLAEWIANQIGSRQAVEELIPGRLWWLGGPLIDRRRADLFLAVGCNRADAQSVFSSNGCIGECTTPIVLIPSDVPRTHALVTESKVLSLSRLLRLHDGALELDMQEIERIVGKSRVKRVQGVIPFPTPPNTTWDEVVIVLTADGESAQVTAGGLTLIKTFQEMGFSDNRRTDEPDKLWKLLQFMATHNAELSWDDKLSEEDILKRKRQVSDIRARLRKYFSIPGDPFEPYRKTRSYQAKFTIHMAGQRPR